MDNQHRKISGYRELSEKEIEFMNRVKALGPVLEMLTKDLKKYLVIQRANALNSQNIPELERLDNCDALNWLDRGTHDLQTGLMKLTRSIAQPTFF